MAEHRLVINVRQDPALKDRPEDSAAAVAFLNRGNEGFASLGEPNTYELTIGAEAIGLSRGDGRTLPQEPLAAFLACADARVPVEVVFAHFANDLFVTRVAGNFAGIDAVGALHFAISHLPTVKVVAVLGHEDCGAVTAAADSVLHPAGYLELMRDAPLRNSVNALVPAVMMARAGLKHVHGPAVVEQDGYREAVVAVAAVANAALNAMELNADLDRDVYFGVYDLNTRLVGVRGGPTGLQPAPADMAAFDEVLFAAARAAIEVA